MAEYMKFRDDGILNISQSGNQIKFLPKDGSTIDAAKYNVSVTDTTISILKKANTFGPQITDISIDETDKNKLKFQHKTGNAFFIISKNKGSVTVTGGCFNKGEIKTIEYGAYPLGIYNMYVGSSYKVLLRTTSSYHLSSLEVEDPYNTIIPIWYNPVPDKQIYKLEVVMRVDS